MTFADCDGVPFSAGIVFRHPVFLVTFILAFIGWFIAFIAMCVAESDLSEYRRVQRANRCGKKPMYSELTPYSWYPSDNLNGGPSMGTLWFAIIFQLAIIVHLL